MARSIVSGRPMCCKQLVLDTPYGGSNFQVVVNFVKVMLRLLGAFLRSQKSRLKVVWCLDNVYFWTKFEAQVL